MAFPWLLVRILPPVIRRCRSLRRLRKKKSPIIDQKATNTNWNSLKMMPSFPLEKSTIWPTEVYPQSTCGLDVVRYWLAVVWFAASFMHSLWLKKRSTSWLKTHKDVKWRSLHSLFGLAISHCDNHLLLLPPHNLLIELTPLHSHHCPKAIFGCKYIDATIFLFLLISPFRNLHCTPYNDPKHLASSQLFVLLCQLP